MPSTLPTLRIDLDLAPERRWATLSPFSEVMRDMFQSFGEDLEDLGEFESQVRGYVEAFVPEEIRRELAAVAEIAGVSFEHCSLVNLYYDALKLVMGCTAFAVDSPNGPLHARNLDWWNPGGLLSSSTLIYEFYRQGELRFRTVSWPGFVGALSGLAPGRFGVTLNAVLSTDTAEFQAPVTLLLRDVLDTAPSYTDAVQRLREERILCDCLILVSGTKDGEFCVIERTPRRAAVREAEHGMVAVTNDYRALTDAGAKFSTGESPLQETACSRYERCRELGQNRRVDSPGAALEVLHDAQVQMEITVQRMVFCARTGLTQVERVDSASEADR
jgi:acid ceramidase